MPHSSPHTPHTDTTPLEQPQTASATPAGAERAVRFRLWQLLLPILISMGVVYFLLRDSVTSDALRDFSFTSRSITGILLALLMWVIQNAAMAHRYYTMAHPYMSRCGAFRVTLLADFASAVTPSAVGGSTVVFLFLGKEGVSPGRATAITISGLFLDELLMSLLSILMLLFVHQGLEMGHVPVLSVGLNITFVLLSIVLSLWTALLYFGLFHKPQWVGQLLRRITSWRPLHRFRDAATKLEQDMVVTSQEMRQASLWYWLKLFGATIVSWLGRYGIACMLIYGFGSQEGSLLMAFVRQIVIWLLAIIMPTPGGSGFAEYMFQVAYEEFFPSAAVAIIVALIWRWITSYSYLVLGPLLLWYQFGRKKGAQQPSEPAE